MKSSYFGIERQSVLNRSTVGLRSHRVGHATLTAEEEDRIKILKVEFAAIDRDGDKKLTLQELFDFIGSKVKNDQTFDKMDKNQDGTVSTQEFILSYVDAEQFILKRIKEVNETLKENRKTLQETKKGQIRLILLSNTMNTTL